MNLSFEPLHPDFAAVVRGVDVSEARDEAVLERIRSGLDRHAVLVFREQRLDDERQVAFARRLDGTLHTSTTLAVVTDQGSGTRAALTDISNVDAAGTLLERGDRRRMTSLANRLWHTDASFVDPAGRYSLLSARRLPSVRADTEFVDMRAAYDGLDPETRRSIDGLTVLHSAIYSRGLLGFEFSEDERRRLPGAVHPMVRHLPRSGRRALYLASHASHVVGRPIADGRLLILDLIEHATQPHRIYRHCWKPGDLVIWDNRATMHRARPFDDTKHVRDLRRTTTLDL